MSNEQSTDTSSQQIICVKCNTPFWVMWPIVRVMNAPEVSVVNLIHVELEQCPKCKTLYTCAIADVIPAIKLTWVEVPPDKAKHTHIRAEHTDPRAVDLLPNASEANVMVRPTVKAPEGKPQ